MLSRYEGHTRAGYQLGLRVNDWDWYSASLIKALKALDISESDIDSLVTIVQKEYTYKYTDCNRKPQICFFTRLVLQHSDGSPAYDSFLQNIGGELVRRPLKNCPEQKKNYEILFKSGTPVIVKAALPFTDLVAHLHSSVAGQFIRFYVAKYYWNYTYKINYDCYMAKDVPAEQIVDIIPVQAQQRSCD